MTQTTNSISNVEPQEVHPHSFRKALTTGGVPTATMLPLSRLVGFGPCGGAIREGAWAAPAVIVLAAGGIVSALASVRYFMRAYPRHRVLSPALGAAFSIWNGMLTMFLVFMLLFAIAG